MCIRERAKLVDCICQGLCSMDSMTALTSNTRTDTTNESDKVTFLTKPLLVSGDVHFF